jgi:hypothetical protein
MHHTNKTDAATRSQSRIAKATSQECTQFAVHLEVRSHTMRGALQTAPPLKVAALKLHTEYVHVTEYTPMVATSHHNDLVPD